MVSVRSTGWSSPVGCNNGTVFLGSPGSQEMNFVMTLQITLCLLIVGDILCHHLIIHESSEECYDGILLACKNKKVYM